MSWDVFLFQAPQGLRSISEMPNDYQPPKFERSRAVAVISALFPDGAEFSDPTWGHISGDGWSMEVSAGQDEASDGIMLHIRGGGDPVTAALAIANELGLLAIDCSSGEILTLENNCFNQWRAYRDQVIAASREPSLLERVRGWFRGWS